ncbi:MAG: hypothetical protein K9L62_00405 [Vallitaleaceae bacterium]|nr:hypothetical protein [Vallitaleaceae bacterium]
MATHLNRSVGEMEYDKLIAGVTPPIHVNSGIINQLAVAADYVRGTVLAKSTASGKLYILGTAAAESSEKFSGDGNETQFTLTDKPLIINSVEVGGSAVTVTSYDASTGVVTLAAAPEAGSDNVEVFYPEEELIPDCILCDDVSVGTEADTNVAVYTGGCFNIDALTVKDEYTMTEADKDKLRERGIYLGTVWHD